MLLSSKYNLLLLSVLYPFLLFAEPTENRTWTSIKGTTFEGKATQMENGITSLVGADGRQITVPLDQFSPEDQALLREQFRPKPVSPTPPANLPHEQGRVINKISADDLSSYALYLPKSMDGEVEPPFLFFNSPVQATPSLLKRFQEASELTGAALVISLEASNANRGPRQNGEHVKACIQHIEETLPIDTQRAIFAGASGGAARSFAYAQDLSAIGAIPFVGYLPRSHDISNKVFYYIAGGGIDYNRYLSAAAAEKAGKRGIYRTYPGGHSGAKGYEATESLLWVYTRHIYENPSEHEREIALFESRFLPWLEKKTQSEPHLAYFWCQHLLETCQIQGGRSADIEQMHTKLANDPSCIRYLDCYNALLDFTQKHYTPIGEEGGSRYGHTTSELESAAAKFLAEYPDVPGLSEAIAQLGLPTFKAGRK